MPARHTQSIHLFAGDRITVELAKLHAEYGGGWVTLDVGGVQLSIHTQSLDALWLDLNAVLLAVDDLAKHEAMIGRVA